MARGHFRLVMTEAAQTLHWEAAAALWDIHKYYNSMRLPRLLQVASSPALTFPLGVLCFTLQTALAPRFLKYVLGASQPIHPNTSVLHGVFLVHQQCHDHVL